MVYISVKIRIILEHEDISYSFREELRVTLYCLVYIILHSFSIGDIPISFVNTFVGKMSMKTNNCSYRELTKKVMLQNHFLWYFIKMSTNPLQVKVQICVQFFKVGEIDTLKEQFTADVVVKAKWREPTLDGQNKTASILAFVNFNLHLYVYNII